MASNAGRCNCGRFAFALPPPQANAICFCMSCTRTGGSIASNNAVVNPAEIQWNKGSKEELNVYEDKDTASGSPIHRYFCGTCGSAIMSIPSGNKDIAYAKVSALDNREAYLGNKSPNAIFFTKHQPQWLAKHLSVPEGTATFEAMT